MYRIALAAASLGVLLALAPASRAGTMLDPTSVSTNMGSLGSGHGPVNAINQSGLSAGYTSGVADFDTYLAANPN
jgi:hypothetical protein